MKDSHSSRKPIRIPQAVTATVSMQHSSNDPMLKIRPAKMAGMSLTVKARPQTPAMMPTAPLMMGKKQNRRLNNSSTRMQD